jgi:hypothetical protein
VSLFFNVTVALGTAAPLGSVTVPVTAPLVKDCPKAEQETPKKQAAKNVKASHREKAYDFINQIS